MKFVLIALIFSFNLYASTLEVSVAKKLKSVYSSLRKGKPTYINLKKLRKDAIKSDTFDHYKRDLYLLNKIRSLGYLKRTHCKIVHESKNIVHTRFRKELYKYCHGHKLFRLTTINKFKINSVDTSIDYLLEHNPRYLSRILDALKRYKSNYLAISEFLTIRSKDHDLNEYLINHYASNKNTKSKNKSIEHYKNIKKLYREFKKTLENGSRKTIHLSSTNLLQYFKDNTPTLTKTNAGKFIIYSATHLQRKGMISQSRNVLKEVYQLVVKDNLKSEAKFRILWTSISQNNYKEALKDIENYQLIESFNTQSSKIKFWTAYVLKHSDESSIANHLFDQLIKSDPLSYYSILSKREYANYDLSVYKDDDQLFRHIDINEKNFSKEFVSDVHESKIWSNISHHYFANKILKQIAKTQAFNVIINKDLLNDFNKQDLNKVLAVSMLNEFKKVDDFLSSFRLLNSYLARHIVKLNEFDLRYIFPKKYYNIIKKYSGAVDPLFVLSLIRQESAFDKDIVSHANARGLMQLLPSTARSLERIRNSRELFKPDTNIRLGTKYLNKLMKQFDGNLIYTLSAYNAGPTKTKSWIKNVFDKEDPLKLIEEIPYKETRMYVKLIYRNIYFYQFLYEKRRKPQSLEKSFIVSQNIK